METLGEAIKRIRKSKNPKITITKLASAVGVVQSFITEVERDRKIPTPDVFDKILNELGENLKLRSLYSYYQQSNKQNADLIKEVKSLKESNFIFAELLEKFLHLKERDFKVFIDNVLHEYIQNIDDRNNLKGNVIPKILQSKRAFKKISNSVITELKALSKQLNLRTLEPQRLQRDAPPPKDYRHA